MKPTLDVDELAAELGRSRAWVYENWLRQAKIGRLPMPLHGGTGPLVWSRAHLYAVLDVPLTPTQRLAAQAYRAAEAAARAAPLDATAALDDADWRARLDARAAARASAGGQQAAE